MKARFYSIFSWLLKLEIKTRIVYALFLIFKCEGKLEY